MLTQNTNLGFAVAIGAAIAGALSFSGSLQPAVMAQATPCPDTPQSYQADYQKPRNPQAVLSVVCYQYAVQRDPSGVPAVTTAQVDRKKLVDVFGKKVLDKQIFEEVWRPLPGFEGLFYDEKTLSKYYRGGKNMLQLPGTSTLGDNLFKVAITVDCDNYKIQYEGVARRLTRVYDYQNRYQLAGGFATEKVQTLCNELGDPPAKIGL
jgi:hypothetical protein